MEGGIKEGGSMVWVNVPRLLCLHLVNILPFSKFPLGIALRKKNRVRSVAARCLLLLVQVAWNAQKHSVTIFFCCIAN